MNISIQDQVYEIVRKHIKIAPENLKIDTPLAESGIDSLATTEIAFEIEDALGIEIPDAEITKDRFKAFYSVADVVNMVNEIKNAHELK